MAENIGKVISVSGPAVDIQFEEKNMPPIYQALRIVSDGFTVPTTDWTSSSRCSSTSAKAACAPSPWSPPKASSAA